MFDNRYFNYQSLADVANNNTEMDDNDPNKKKGIITGTMVLGNQRGTFNGDFDTNQLVQQLQHASTYMNPALNVSTPTPIQQQTQQPIQQPTQNVQQTDLPVGNQAYQLPTNNEVGNFPQVQQPTLIQGQVPQQTMPQPEQPSNIMNAFLYASKPQVEPTPQPMAPQEMFNNYQQTIFGQQPEQSNINPVIEQPAQDNTNPQDMFNNYQQQVYGSPAPVAPENNIRIPLPYSTEQTTPNGYYSSSNPMSMDVVWHPTDGGRYQSGMGPDNTPFYQYQQQNPETGEYGMFDGSKFMPGTGIGY